MGEIVCQWEWVIPGMWVVECRKGRGPEHMRLWVPKNSQMDAKEFGYCPYCGKRLELEGAIDPRIMEQMRSEIQSWEGE